jgi:hypothetical protein
MPARGAKQDVQVSIGKGFVIIGGDRVEVSPDGKKVTAYTNDGVETMTTKPAPVMPRGASERGISISADFNTVVLNGVLIQRAFEGHLVISSPGTVVIKPRPANDTAANDAGKALEVGEHLKDGTVVIAVDLEHNEALRVPEGIFGGNDRFDYQDEVVEEVNAGSGTHGHKDWRRITDEEGKTLSEVWNKVAPAALKGRAAPWFWLASPYSFNYTSNLGRVRRGGEADWYSRNRYDSLPVPVVRSGPAQS